MVPLCDHHALKDNVLPFSVFPERSHVSLLSNRTVPCDPWVNQIIL